MSGRAPGRLTPHAAGESSALCRQNVLCCRGREFRRKTGYALARPFEDLDFDAAEPERKPIAVRGPAVSRQRQFLTDRDAISVPPGVYRAELKLDLGMAAILVGETQVRITR